MNKRIKIPKRLAWLLLGLAALILLIILVRHANFNSMASFFSRLQSGIAARIYYVKDSVRSVKYVSSARTGILALTEKNLKLEIENRELAAENDRLKKTLQLKQGNEFKRYTKCYASVIGANDDGFIQYYLIDKGSSNGVAVGDGVVNDDGVIGRIMTVMAASAKVQLITDVKSAISARVERSKVVGILTGKGIGLCGLEKVPKEEDVAVGDIIVTSGLGTSFPEGIKICKVTDVDKKSDSLSVKVKAKPFGDIFKVQEVIIVSK
jgi:rod shape-determining protein MreC